MPLAIIQWEMCPRNQFEGQHFGPLENIFCMICGSFLRRTFLEWNYHFASLGQVAGGGTSQWPLVTGIRSHEQRLSQLQPPSASGLIVSGHWAVLPWSQSDFSRDGHQRARSWSWLPTVERQHRELISLILSPLTSVQHSLFRLPSATGSWKGVMRGHASAPILPLRNMSHVHGNTSKDINMRSDS